MLLLSRLNALFFFKELAYKLAPHVEQLAIHFQIDGNLIHKDSEEAKRQAAAAQPESTNLIIFFDYLSYNIFNSFI